MKTKVRCCAKRADGGACRNWAVHESDPPRCPSHGGGKRPVGGQAGNTNAVKHGYYHTPEPGVIEPKLALPPLQQLLISLASKQARVSRYLDDHLAEMEVPMLAHVFALHARGAWRIGQVLREIRSARKVSDADIADAIDEALDALSIELGVQL